MAETFSSPPLKILFVTSECVPYAKAGGLGDVVSGLAKALTKLGHEVRIIMPLYSSIDLEQYQIKFKNSSCVHFGENKEEWIGVYEGVLDQTVPIWFIDHQRFFHRNGIYDDGKQEYQDNAFRYALLSKSAIQVCKDIDFFPHVMHLHDWPTAPVAAFLKTWDRMLSPLSDTASVLTIHNIGYPGVYEKDVLSMMGMSDEYWVPDIFEDHGKVNLLKSGIYFADAITTVSPTHANEILDPVGGKGLAPYLEKRRSDLFGILNGVDYEHWSPENDPLLPKNYSTKDLSGKLECKKALRSHFGLQETKAPILGIVSRFVHQKGVHLFREIMVHALRQLDFQFVALGSGEQETESFFQWLASEFPGRVGVHIGFSNDLSHLIEGGSDFFLMPSLYEPCGLSQIYSLHYGTIPIVRATGGLSDTVIAYDPSQKRNKGTGLIFNNPSGHDFYAAIAAAVRLWEEKPKEIEKIRKRGMAEVFDWNKSAKEYVRVYRHAIEKRKGGA